MQTKSSVHLPAPADVVDPLRLLTQRVIIAMSVLVLTALLVYVDRDGYNDNSDGSVDLLDAF